MTKVRRNKRIDWPSLKKDYRTGRYTLADLAEKYNCAKSTIFKRINKDGDWTKDLAPKIREAIQSRVLIPEGSGPLSDDEIVDIAAAESVEVLRQHKRRIQRLSGVADSLVDELEKALQKESDEDNPDSPVPKVSHVLLQTTSTVEKLIKLERQAFYLDESNSDSGDKTLEELLAAAACE